MDAQKTPAHAGLQKLLHQPLPDKHLPLKLIAPHETAQGLEMSREPGAIQDSQHTSGPQDLGPPAKGHAMENKPRVTPQARLPLRLPRRAQRTLGPVPPLVHGPGQQAEEGHYAGAHAANEGGDQFCHDALTSGVHACDCTPVRTPAARHGRGNANARPMKHPLSRRGVRKAQGHRPDHTPAHLDRIPAPGDNANAPAS